MATNDPTSTVCVGLLCGIPACGKSTVAVQLCDHVIESVPGQLGVVFLQYDDLMPADLEKRLIEEVNEQGNSLWKLTRNQILTCVDILLRDLAQGDTDTPLFHSNCSNPCCSLSKPQEPSTASGKVKDSFPWERPDCIDCALWERFVSACGNSLSRVLHRRTGVSLWSSEAASSPWLQAASPWSSETVSSPWLQAASRWLVLIDDNMQYRSMRYQYCQLARKYGVGLSILHVSCPLEVALTRNRSRTEGRVEDHVIANMDQRLEVPDAGKHVWERHSTTVDGAATMDVQQVLDVVLQAINDPLRPSPEEDTEVKVISRYQCSTSVVHQTDQILRRCVSLRMGEAKGLGCSQEDLKTLSAKLSKSRGDILSGMKSGDITLPFQPEDRCVADASKDTSSPLFCFLLDLFNTV